jgi:hypothetical protein
MVLKRYSWIWPRFTRASVMAVCIARNSCSFLRPQHELLITQTQPRTNLVSANESGLLLFMFAPQISRPIWPRQSKQDINEKVVNTRTFKGSQVQLSLSSLVLYSSPPVQHPLPHLTRCECARPASINKTDFYGHLTRSA